MNSDGKKISFGFSKLSKKPNVLPPPLKENKTVELIDCLEGTETKVKNAAEKVEIAPLVIPIRGDANNIVSQIERGRSKIKKLQTETNDEDLRPDSELTIEELAARQLLREARNKLAQGKDTTKVHTLLLTENSTVQDGIEPSMDDYENVPIEDFGLALLRGMGWKEELSNPSKFVTPDLRPKGLGLGGQKIVDVKVEDVFDKDGKQLVLKEGAFAKIVAGPHKGKFCEVQFCDQWTGRVGVKASKTNEILVLNELFVVPITKEDYIIGSKVINNAKYEQYKQMEKNEDHSNKRFIEKMSEAADSMLKKRDDITRPKESQRDRDQVKVEYDSFDESIKQEVSSNDEYEKEKNRSRGKYNEKRKDHYRSVNNHERTPDENKRDSSVEYSKEKSRTKYNNSRYRASSEEYERDKSKTKKNRHFNSEESSEEYNRRKHEAEDVYNRSKSTSNEKRKIKTEYRRSRSRDSLVNYDKKKSNTRSRSSSSEDYGRNKPNSRNRSRSRSLSKDDKKKTTKKDKKKMKEKKRSGKSSSSRYSDDDYERKYSKKHRQKNDTDEESLCEVKRENKSKKNKKSSRKRYSSSESDYEIKKSKNVEDRVKTGKHKSRH